MRGEGNREAFLHTITAALRRAPSHVEDQGPAMPVDSEVEAVGQTFQSAARAGFRACPTDCFAPREALVAQMEAELEKVEGRLHRAATVEEARDLILDLVRQRAVERVVVCNGADLEGMGLVEALCAAGIAVVGSDLEPEALRQAMIEADMGISGVDYAIAETGTVVLVAGQGVPRNATALPAIHVAVMQPEQLIPSLEAVTALLKQRLLAEDGTWAASCVTFITGPSRTADIEQTLTIGVHGPGEVHVVIAGT